MEQEITLQQLSEKIDNLAKISLIGVKKDLHLDEAAMYLGLSEGYLYRLVQEEKLPVSRQSRRLYFSKTDLDRWIEKGKVKSKSEISSMATTYVVTHRK